MDDTTRRWQDKIEDKVDQNGTLLTQVATKLDLYFSRTDENDGRLDILEKYMHSQEAVNARLVDNTKLRWLKITALIIGFEIIGGILGVILGTILHRM